MSGRKLIFEIMFAQKKLIITLITIILLELISAVFLKNTHLWTNKDWEEKYWRIESKIYHHDLLPNVNVIENWGGNLQKRILTNSLGFRDF